MTKCVCEEGNPNLAGVKGRINKIKRCGARTFISDGPGRDRIGPACCFPPSAGVMFAGSMCCKVGVVLARALCAGSCSQGEAAPAPVRGGPPSDAEPGRGVKVLTTLKLETEPGSDTEYSACHFMFPFTNINPLPGWLSRPLTLCLFVCF